MNLPGVKPASEWIDKTPGVIEDIEHHDDLIDLYRRIAAQAFAAGVQQGMTKAAEIAGAVGCSVIICGDEFHGQRCPVSRQHAILAARDEK